MNSIKPGQFSTFLPANFAHLSHSQSGYLCLDGDDLIEVGLLWKIIQEIKGFIGFENYTSSKVIGDYLVTHIKSAKQKYHVIDAQEAAIITAIATRSQSYNNQNPSLNHAKLARKITQLLFLEDKKKSQNQESTDEASNLISTPQPNEENKGSASEEPKIVQTEGSVSEVPFEDEEVPVDSNPSEENVGDSSANLVEDPEKIDDLSVQVVVDEVNPGIDVKPIEINIEQEQSTEIETTKIGQEFEDIFSLNNTQNETAWNVREVAFAAFTVLFWSFAGALLYRQQKVKLPPKPVSNSTFCNRTMSPLDGWKLLPSENKNLGSFFKPPFEFPPPFFSNDTSRLEELSKVVNKSTNNTIFCNRTMSPLDGWKLLPAENDDTRRLS